MPPVPRSRRPQPYPRISPFTFSSRVNASFSGFRKKATMKRRHNGRAARAAPLQKFDTAINSGYNTLYILSYY